ncbi:MAG TPA: SUMF1/EgtB/PvdO family nonheme iron enzyme [Thermoanaerobaculia bacterium]|nr:SUMF1/EgtB/PvdO family nonheme iron enzyme [Thermoanaerobaculia bacterium]
MGKVRAMPQVEAPTDRFLDRRRAVDWYRSNRRRSAEIFDLLSPDAYYDRPIALRNPIAFYEGHLPAFSVNTLLKKGLGERGIDAGFEVLFERGIDPEDVSSVPGVAPRGWPSRSEIQAYGREADRLIFEALESKDVTRADNPVLRRGLAAYTILEHEEMHQETLLYMWHRLPYEKKHAPRGAPSPLLGGEPPRERRRVRVPAGRATLGARRDRIPFGWDNEFDEVAVDVSEFEIDVHDVTNREFLEFIAAGGYDRDDLWSAEGREWRVRNDVRHPVFWERRGGEWVWRGMFGDVPLPPSWPVFVSHAEASAYAKWRGARLPTEAEFHRAAYGTPSGSERSYPWGEELPDASRGNFDFARWDPAPVGSFPAGASAWGVQDLLGNGWEWTSTVFAPFPGFEPMPSYPVYSADFFDGKHWVMKGGSFATSKTLLRRSLRNWFRGNYPYVYATFRTVAD